jgi:hypothetical protein
MILLLRDAAVSCGLIYLMLLVDMPETLEGKLLI